MLEAFAVTTMALVISVSSRQTVNIFLFMRSPFGGKDGYVTAPSLLLFYYCRICAFQAAF